MKYLPRLVPLDADTGAAGTAPPYMPGELPVRPEEVVDTLARTIWAEARDRSLRALEGMAAVVVNRARRGGRPGGEALGAAVAALCLAPGAFALGTPDHPDRAAALAVTAADPVFAVCLRIARVALAGVLDDPTHGATHVHRIGDNPPWALGRAPAAELRRPALLQRHPLTVRSDRDDPSPACPARPAAADPRGQHGARPHDHPAARAAAESLTQLGQAVDSGQITPDQVAEANRHVERMADLDSGDYRTAIQEVNATMRAEAGSGDAYVRRMRPTFGYIMALTWAAQMGAIAYTIVVNPGAAAAVIADMASLSVIWTVGLSVLGIYVYKRSQEKQAMLPDGGRPDGGGPLGRLAQRLTGAGSR